MSSLFDPTWDFSKSSELSFDQNFVEVINGQARLKSVDLNHEGADFSEGTHVGSSFFNKKITLISDVDSTSSHVNSILASKSNDLIGYWRMEGNWLDESSSEANGSPQNFPLFTTDSKLGEYSGSFDGLNQRIDIGDVSELKPTKVSISAWFRLTDNTPSIQFIGGYGSTGSEGYWLGFVSRNLTFFASDGITSGSSAQTDSLIIPDENTWYHVTGTFEAGTSKIYLNGELKRTTTNVAGNLSYVGLADGFVIGNIEGLVGSRHFNGDIDEISIWKEVLTADEIHKLYESQNKNYTELSSSWTPKYNDIVGYWKMDGNWLDSSGLGLHGTPVNSPLFTEGKVGTSSGSLDGTSQHISVGTQAQLQPVNVSMSAWVRVTTAPKAIEFVGGYAATSGEGYFLGHEGNFSFSACSSAVCGSIERVYSGIVARPNQWYHLVGTYDGATTKIYVDGVLKNTNNAISGNIDYSGITDGFLIGNIDGLSGTRYLEGSIDEIAIWSSPLSASEVATIYQRQKQRYAGHYDSKVIDLGSASSSWPDLSWSTSLPFGKELVGDFDNDGNADTDSLLSYPQVVQTFNDSLVGYWTFNSGFTDSSGNNLTNVVNGDSAIQKEAILGHGSLSLDGTGDFLDLAQGGAPISSKTNDITFSTWIKWKGSTGADQFLFTNGHTGSDGFGCRIDFSDGDLLKCVLGGRDTLGSTFQPKIGEWQHILVTANATNTWTFYVDGTVVHTELSVAMITPVTGTWLGAGQGGVGNFNGQVDEFSFWDRSLSLEEIQQLYRRGANRIKFQVRSCVDPTCECKSFNTSPLGTATDCDGDTIVNALDPSDVYKAEFIGPGGDGSTYYSELFNRKGTDLIFNCGDNTSDSNSNICVDDEITLSAGPKKTNPVIDYSNFPLGSRPQDNQYIQYRTYFEADENMACSGGSPCLPSLESVDLNPDGAEKYYGGLQEIKPTKGISYTALLGATIDADSCATFQLSSDGSNFYYWNSTNWVLSSSNADRSTKEDIESNISSFGSQFGPGSLFIKAFLQTNSNQTSQCSINKIDIEYSRK